MPNQMPVEGRNGDGALGLPDQRPGTNGESPGPAPNDGRADGSDGHHRRKAALGKVHGLDVAIRGLQPLPDYELDRFQMRLQQCEVCARHGI